MVHLSGGRNSQKPNYKQLHLFLIFVALTYYNRPSFATGLNYLTLMNLQKTAGLGAEIRKCFRYHFGAVFPGITANNISKLINDYFAKSANARKAAAAAGD